MKKKIPYCRVCNKDIASNQGYFKIKEKIIYPDLDGNWWAMHKVCICESCIRTIRKIVKAQV